MAAGLEEDFYQHRTCAAPPPQHQQPQITFHRTIAMTLIIPNSPPDSHISRPLSLVTLFPSIWLSLTNFPSSLFWKFHFLSIVFIKLDLGFHLFGVGEDRVDIDNKKEEGRKGAPAARGWNSFASDFGSQTF